MAYISAVFNSDVGKYINAQVHKQLNGKSLACAVNALNYLVYSERIKRLAPNVAYFCATHAVEEAVTALVESAKFNGYKEWVSLINTRDHKDKAIVAAYAQMIVGLAQDLELKVAYSRKNDKLYAKWKGGNKSHLSIAMFSFNESMASVSSDNAFDVFIGLFPDDKKMIK